MKHPNSFTPNSPAPSHPSRSSTLTPHHQSRPVSSRKPNPPQGHVGDDDLRDAVRHERISVLAVLADHPGQLLPKSNGAGTGPSDSARATGSGPSSVRRWLEAPSWGCLETRDISEAKSSGFIERQLISSRIPHSFPLRYGKENWTPTCQCRSLLSGRLQEPLPSRNAHLLVHPQVQFCILPASSSFLGDSGHVSSGGDSF